MPSFQSEVRLDTVLWGWRAALHQERTCFLGGSLARDPNEYLLIIDHNKLSTESSFPLRIESVSVRIRETS